MKYATATKIVSPLALLCILGANANALECPAGTVPVKGTMTYASAPEQIERTNFHGYNPQTGELSLIGQLNSIPQNRNFSAEFCYDPNHDILTETYLKDSLFGTHVRYSVAAKHWDNGGELNFIAVEDGDIADFSINSYYKTGENLAEAMRIVGEAMNNNPQVATDDNSRRLEGMIVTVGNGPHNVTVPEGVSVSVNSSPLNPNANGQAELPNNQTDAMLIIGDKSFPLASTTHTYIDAHGPTTCIEGEPIDISMTFMNVPTSIPRDSLKANVYGTGNKTCQLGPNEYPVTGELYSTWAGKKQPLFNGKDYVTVVGEQECPGGACEF